MNPFEKQSPNPSPWMTVVIPSFNQRDYLIRTLRSVEAAVESLRNSSAGREKIVDVWVQDGGSTDGTVEILEKHSRKGHLGFTSGRDDGQSAAINTAIREHARGKWIGWINSDDLWDADALVRLVGAEKSSPDSAWFHGSVRIVDQEDREIRKWISAYKRAMNQSLSWERLLLENLIAQMGTFFTREAFLEVGGLDRALHYNMDYDLWLKLWRRFGPPGELTPMSRPLGSFRMVRGTKSMDGFRKQFTESLEVGLRHRANADSARPEFRPPSLMAMKWARQRIVWVYEILKFFRI